MFSVQESFTNLQRAFSQRERLVIFPRASQSESLLKPHARVMQSAISVCRDMRLLDPNLIAASRRSIQSGAYCQQEDACRFGYKWYLFLTLRPAFGVE